MKRKNIKLLAAGVIFALLLCLILMDLYRLRMYMLDLLMSAPLILLHNFGPPLLCAVILLILTVGSFRGKLDPARKVPYAILYLVGELFPVAESIIYVLGPNLLYYLRSPRVLLTVAEIGLFLLALFVLAKDAPSADPLQPAGPAIDGGKLSFYENLYRDGVLTKEEYAAMKKKIEQGLL